jgi:hypothetical protein
MRPIQTFFAAMAVASLPLSISPFSAQAATLGGSSYAVQYDYREFYAATDHKKFRVELVGNPFPNLPLDEVARRLLPVMQANKPPPNLTFTYEVPPEPQRPDYRLMLVFDPANDLGSDAVCTGGKRLKPGVPGHVYVYAVYCRNDQVLSEVTGRTLAAAPDDAAMGDLMKDVFTVVFDRSPYNMLHRNHSPIH